MPAVRATCSQIGLGFDPWQVGVARCILAKDSSGLYAADTVVLSIPRQVGKTYLVGALVFADCIINPGTTTVWTAHRFKVARETFNELKAVALSPALAPHIDPDDIYTAAGNESITFRNGSRIVFAARERGAIRGFSKVRRIVLDEGQILTEAAMADLAPTMNQAENPQLIIMGTPPKPGDPSEVFTNLRDEALSGRSEGIVYVEFSADPGSDVDDRKAWRKANPSYPSRTSTRAILRLRKLLSDDDFAREALGMWDAAQGFQVIDPAVWESRADSLSQVEDPVVFAVDVAPMGRAASISLAGRRSDGLFHVEVVKNARGTEWLVPALESLQARWSPAAIVLDRVGPANGVILDLQQRRFRKLLLTSSTDMAQGCGAFLDAVVNNQLRHVDQPLLNSALGSAKKRAIGDAWGWNRRDENQDITPLVSATLALWGFQSKVKRKRSGPQRAIVMA